MSEKELAQKILKIIHQPATEVSDGEVIDEIVEILSKITSEE